MSRRLSESLRRSSHDPQDHAHALPLHHSPLHKTSSHDIASLRSIRSLLLAEPFQDLPRDIDEVAETSSAALRSIVSNIDINQELTDSEDEDEFIHKYGDIQVQYIKKPKESAWFIRPHALNYFKDGVLFRTKNERGSAKTELFLDLMYVGIIANLAGEASENALGIALLKYVLFFFPIWQVWSDIKDFTNYYYNEDFTQKLYIMWIIVLLTLYVNSHTKLLESRSGAALTVIPYILCRLSLAVSLFIYSFYIPEHRPQQRLYAGLIVVSSCLWVIIIFVSNRAKIGVAIGLFFVEQAFYAAVYHPKTKRMMKLTTSTALNIEHEVERFSVFVTIAIGEFLYKIVATNPLGAGFSDKFLRAFFMLFSSYILFWIYQMGSTCKRATHPLRASGLRAVLFIYLHFPLVASLVLAADAGGVLTGLDITSTRKPHAEHEVGGHEKREEELNYYALSFFYSGGIAVSLLSLCWLGLLDVSRDPPENYVLSRFWRVIWRAPAGIAIVMLSFAEMDSTLLMGIITAILLVLLMFEAVTSTPREECDTYTPNVFKKKPQPVAL